MTEAILQVHPVALCMWREARGEGQDGMRAVGHVIRNRGERWYAHFVDPFHFAVYAKNQFPSMSDPADPNYRRFPADVDPQWQFCTAISPKILDRSDVDLTGGALYYARLDQISSGGWFYLNIVEQPRAHPLLAIIGHQSFYA